jgi:phage replication-related protein YjqB (UPF0714/DUF867 family)
MFDQLLAHPGVDEELVLRSQFGFLAFHGGSLEEVTDEIATRAAERAGASLYAVRQPPDLRWHIPSALIDPAHSPSLAAFLDHVDVAVAIHGYGRMGMWTTLLLGGTNRELAAEVATHLSSVLPDYTVIDDLESIPSELRGLHPDNPVNRPRFGGVQVELPPRVRGMGPFWAEWDAAGLNPHTDALIDGLAASAEGGLLGRR